MTWQETAALAIVAVTAAVFLWRGLKRKQGGLPCDHGCGCSSSSSAAKDQPVTVLQARKGQPSRLRVK